MKYQGYGGGYVECCEEVVDPIILLGVLAGRGENAKKVFKLIANTEVECLVVLDTICLK